MTSRKLYRDFWKAFSRLGSTAIGLMFGRFWEQPEAAAWMERLNTDAQRKGLPGCASGGQLGRKHVSHEMSNSVGRD